jgi:hypothetical protein
VAKVNPAAKTFNPIRSADPLGLDPNVDYSSKAEATNEALDYIKTLFGDCKERGGMICKARANRAYFFTPPNLGFRRPDNKGQRVPFGVCPGYANDEATYQLKAFVSTRRKSAK